MSSAAVLRVYVVVSIVNRCIVCDCHCIGFDGVLYVSACTELKEQGCLGWEETAGSLFILTERQKWRIKDSERGGGGERKGGRH